MTNPDFDPDEGIKFINPDGTTTTMGRSMIARDDFISSLGATSTSGWSQESRADGKQGSSGVISSELRGIVRPRTAPAVRLSNLVEQTDIDNRLRDVVDKKMKDAQEIRAKHNFRCSYKCMFYFYILLFFHIHRIGQIFCGLQTQFAKAASANQHI